MILKSFLRRSKITWGWGTAMRNLGVPSKNKNLSCYYLFAMKEMNLRGGHKWLLIILSHLL